MKVHIFPDKTAMGQAAATAAAQVLKEVLAKKGRARFVVATGASQFEFLSHITAIPGIAWDKTTMFHLDEYIGLPETHPASFRKYLKERFIQKVNPAFVHLVQGDAPDPEAERRRLNALLAEGPIDVSFVGIGENSHLAFNDPPADFDIEDPFLIVNLDEGCRKQQLGEGWFPDLDSVPMRAMSQSIRQIMKAGTIICTVPDARKARAVAACLEGPVTNLEPASILQRHGDCRVFLDAPAASLLKKA